MSIWGYRVFGVVVVDNVSGMVGDGERWRRADMVNEKKEGMGRSRETVRDSQVGGREKERRKKRETERKRY